MDDQKKAMQCKRITVDRFLLATLYSLVAQLAPVTIFLLAVNFNLFHPITWLLDTTRLILSAYTWLYTLPLIISVCTHGVVWSKVFLSRTHYHRNRFMLILNSGTQKLALLLTHTLVGFFTAWLFVRILNWRAAALSTEANWCLLLSGIFMGNFHFIKSRLRLDHTVPFPLIQQRRFLRIRAHLYSILQRSFITALMPSIIYVSLALLLAPFTLPTVHLGEQSLSTLLGNWRLLVYIWVLASQILSNVQFMQQLFIVFLTEYQSFPLQGPSDLLTLSDALNADQFNIVQELASLDLYTLAEAKDAAQRRRELFSLSIPGGHPYNWRGVSEATMRNVAVFTKQLAAAIENVQSYEKMSQSLSPTGTTAGNAFSHQQAAKVRSASQLAEKILQRQMNENMGIRNMSHIYPGEEAAVADKRPRILQRLPPPQEVQNGVENCLRSVQAKLMALPGIHYLLAEQHYARVYFVLRQSQRIVWLVQGIAALASRSLREDEYGIVQKTLPSIVAQLLELKAVTDQVDVVSMDRGKIRSHQRALRSAVKRSLYSIASSFGDYLNDLILPDADREALLTYVYYREN